MSQFGSNLCILWTSLNILIVKSFKIFLGTARKVSDYFRDSAKITDMNIMINFFKDLNYKTYLSEIIEKIRDFVCRHANILLFAFVVIIVDIIIERFLINREKRLFQIEKDSIAYQYILLEEKRSDIEKVFAEKQTLLDNLQDNYKTTQDISQHVEKMVGYSNQLIQIANNLLNQHKQIDKQQNIILQKKLKDIELIMIDASYNDADYLAYDGSQWTMERMKKKADDMKIPEIHWGNRTALGYVLRTVEQLSRIGDIVEPVYPDGYETEDMEVAFNEQNENDDVDEDIERDEVDEVDEEEKYSSDPDWLPSADKSPADKDNEKLFDDWLTGMFYKSSYKSCFFESERSTNIENTIKMNGLNYFFVSEPTPGYKIMEIKV